MCARISAADTCTLWPCPGSRECIGAQVDFLVESLFDAADLLIEPANFRKQPFPVPGLFFHSPLEQIEPRLKRHESSSGSLVSIPSSVKPR
jgi:hypothetical protein